MLPISTSTSARMAVQDPNDIETAQQPLPGWQQHAGHRVHAETPPLCMQRRWSL